METFDVPEMGGLPIESRRNGVSISDGYGAADPMLL